MITKTTHIGRKVRWFTCPFCGLEMKGVAQNMDTDEKIPACPNCLEQMSEVFPDCKEDLDDAIANGTGSEIDQVLVIPKIGLSFNAPEEVLDHVVPPPEDPVAAVNAMPSSIRKGRPASPKCKTCSHGSIVDDRGEKNYKCMLSGKVHAPGASCKLWEKEA